MSTCSAIQNVEYLVLIIGLTFNLVCSCDDNYLRNHLEKICTGKTKYYALFYEFHTILQISKRALIAAFN